MPILSTPFNTPVKNVSHPKPITARKSPIGNKP